MRYRDTHASLKAIYALAVSQGGYFTAKQAALAGIHSRSEKFDRLSLKGDCRRDVGRANGRRPRRACCGRSRWCGRKPDSTLAIAKRTGDRR